MTQFSIRVEVGRGLTPDAIVKGILTSLPAEQQSHIAAAFLYGISEYELQVMTADLPIHAAFGVVTAVKKFAAITGLGTDSRGILVQPIDIPALLGQAK